ncbi:MAG: ATP-dependent DNA ligase [Candidatus Woesearchaeota archaeon]
MKYSTLALAYSSIESTSKRLEKTHLVRELLVKTSEKEIKAVTLLLQGMVFPAWDPRKIGVAEKIVIKALARTLGTKEDNVMKQWKKTGDLGLAAEKLHATKTQVTLFSEVLSVQKVFANLQKLASTEGSGSVDSKIQLIAELLSSASAIEAKYITRTVIGDLRVGIAEGTLRDAIAWAFLDAKENYDQEKKTISPDREKYESVIATIQLAYDRCNDFGTVAEAAIKGEKALATIKLTIGVPIKVMLAQRSKGIEHALEMVGTPADLEYKLDGFRMQIHKSKDGIRLFTRRLEEVTAQFPDVVQAVKKHVKGTEFILDAEVVGFDPKTGKYRAFQDISQRIRRKYGIEEMAKKLPVEVNVFDVLIHNGKETLDLPLKERIKILKDILIPEKRKLIEVSRLITDDAKKGKAFYEKSMAAGNEGIMAKTLEAPYKPGSRVGFMVKVKHVMDTMDLVIVGAEWGEGKRAGWLTSFIVACQSPDGLVEIGKVATGLKELEEQGLSFKEMTDLLKPLIREEKERQITVKPQLVLEVAFEEIQASPTYSSGYALRFPRVRGLREDRGVQDITTLEEVQEAYDLQRGRN